MVNVFVTHEVKDYETWRKGFDADADNRKEAGFNVTGVFQSVDNRNEITVTSEFEDEDRFRSFMSSPQLKETMEKAGVIGDPQIKMMTRA